MVELIFAVHIMYKNIRMKVELKKKKNNFNTKQMIDVNMITQLTRVQRIIVYYLELALY